jgi:hypothetical protein
MSAFTTNNDSNGRNHRMFSMIRKRATYANVAMTLALVFAMSGGAYAAGKYLITSTKQISPKVLKSLVGKTGPAGANGTQGPAGPAGPAGAAGEKGAAGKEGLAGKEGKEGPAGKEGKTGPTGQTGFTATLPEGATETGVVTYAFEAAGSQFVPISFAIPLEAPLGETKVHYILENKKELNHLQEEVAQTACTGTAAAPTAEHGNLCIYETFRYKTRIVIENPTAALPPALFGAATSGAMIYAIAEEAQAYVKASWAVTG